ncbi:MAG: FecR family protein [Saprospiraceae bacterium]|nr:FecR family protein [Saprospiraceae bacterium]
MAHEDLHKFQQDLIQDSSFIAWVKSEFDIDNDRWSVFIDEHIEKMDEINNAIRFVVALDFHDENKIDTKALWSKIESETKPDIKSAKIVKFKPWKMVAAIASIAVAILLIFKPLSHGDYLKTYKASITQRIKEPFPDGSAVTLNPGSEVTFNSKKWEQERRVSLKGLAFFEVRKGASFVVETDKGKITVLGTSFSVDTRNQHFEVICKTGKVSVLSSFGQETILEPGGVATLIGEHLHTQTRPEGAIGLVSWLDGTFTFNDVDYGEVIEEIENQYGVKVNMEASLYTLKYTGFFKNNHLNDALFSITWPLKLKYSIKGTEVFIVKE